MYRLLIVDDEQIIRQGLSLLPWAENEIEVVAILKNGSEYGNNISSEHQKIKNLVLKISPPEYRKCHLKEFWY